MTNARPILPGLAALAALTRLLISGGNDRKRRVLVVLAALVVATIAGLILKPPEWHAAKANPVTTSIGMDTEVSDNTATSLGQIDTCVVAPGAGDQVELDLYVQDVSNIGAYQMRIGYDPALLEVAAVDTGYLLEDNAGSLLVDVIDPLPDTDGVLSIASVDILDPTGESGSGVLARITFEAITVAGGTSDITYVIDATPPVTPALFDNLGSAIGDLDGDDIFDGDISLGSVDVGGDCTRLPNLLMVGFRPGTDAATMDSIIAAKGTVVVEQFSPDEVFTLRIVSGSIVDDTVDSFLTEEDVEFATPVEREELQDHQTYVNDPEFISPRAHQWGLLNSGQVVNNQQGLIDADIDAHQAWDLVTDCRGPDPANPIVIAVLDSGAEVANPDLNGNIWNNPLDGTGSDVLPAVADVNGAAFSTNPATGAIAISGDVTDLVGHGTAVSSVIGAEGNNGREISGVCQAASLLIVKTDLWSSSTVRALQYLSDLKGAGVDLRLINGSYSGLSLRHSQRRLISRLGGQGVLFIAAAGNASLVQSAPAEGIYRDNDNDNSVSNGDTRLTDVIAGGARYVAGSTVACPGDADCGRGLGAFAASEKHADPDGDGQYDQGEGIYVDADNDGAVSSAYDATNSEDGAGANTCNDTLDNGSDGFTDIADGDCYDGDLRLTMVSFGVSQHDSGTRVRCHAPIFVDGDCGDAIISFAANEKHTTDVTAGLPHRAGLDFQQLAYPCSLDLDNIVCVGATDNRDQLASFTNTGVPMVDLFAPGVDTRVLDVIGGSSAEIYRDVDGGNTVSANDVRLVQVRSGPQTYAVGSVVAGADIDVGSPLRPYPANVKHDEILPANGQYDNGEFIYRDTDNPAGNVVSNGDVRLNFSVGGRRTVRCPGDGDCGNALAPFNANEKYNSTRFINGTSFSAPHTTGIAGLCWALMPDRTKEEIKAFLLRFPDRKPAFQGHVVSDGRLRWPCAYELGDAPNSYQTVSREGSAPELLDCALGTEGPIHLDYGNEYYGVDASEEHNADTPAPLDQDGKSNLGPGAPGSCPTNKPNSDLLDNNSHVFTPPPAWVPGQIVQVDFKVCSDFIRDTGGDPSADAQVVDMAAGRYTAANPDKRVYATLWFDWDSDGDFGGEYTPLLPTDVITEVELPVTAQPQVPPTKGCVDVTRTFVAQSSMPPWYRWRLDYGEHKGDNDPDPLFKKDTKLPTDEEIRIAIFGEVEDYPLRSIKLFKLDKGPPYTPLPGWDFNLYDGPDCAGPPLADTQTANENGVADFFGLPEGTYSVKETMRFTWDAVTGVCQVADLTGSMPMEGLDPVPTNVFPPEGGTFNLLMGTRIDIEVQFGDSTLRDQVTLSGPTQVLLSPPGDGDSDGLTDVQTEIVQMDLTGSSEALGPITVRAHPLIRSMGQIEQQTPSSDFPADSFFDVYFEIELPNLGETLYTHDPLPVAPELPIPEWPPFQRPYLPPPSLPPLDLYRDILISVDPAGAIHASMGIIVIPWEQKFIVFVNYQPPTPGDTDHDGFTDEEEVFVGTDPNDACPDNEDDDAWPADMTTISEYGKHDGVSDIFDIVLLTPPVFGKCDGAPEYDVRKDFDRFGAPPDCIDIFDITRLTPPVFGASCAP